MAAISAASLGQECRHTNAKGRRENFEGAECYVSLASLDRSHICPVEIANRSELFLGYAFLSPKRTDIVGEYLPENPAGPPQVFLSHLLSGVKVW